MRKFLVGTAAVVLAVPTISLAGKVATAGDQSLQISVTLKPAVPAKKASKAGVNFAMNVSYKSLNEGAQVKEDNKAITLFLPKGFKAHPEAAPACKFSVLADKEQGEEQCPEGSMIGTGTGTADARPTLPDPVPVEIHVYNGLDDVNVDGTPRDPATPAVIIYAKTTFGLTSTLPFDIIGGRTLRLDFAQDKEGDPPPLFHVQDVKFAVPLKKGAKPYFTRATKCPGGSWGFKMSVENYDGPTVTARHKVRCRK
jgi:hypothetical protein